MLENRIRSLRPIYLVGLLLLLAFIKNGVWHIPNLYVLKKLAADPFRNPFEASEQYLFTNWLGAFLAWITHARSAFRFAWLHAIFSFVFLGTTFVSLRRHLPDIEWRKAICLFMCFPVSWTHLYWIGYDSLTLLLLSLVMASLHLWWAALLLGVGIGLQHFSQGLIALAGLGCVVAFSDASQPGRRTPTLFAVAAALAGICLGWVALKTIILLNSIDLTYDRQNWLADNGLQIITNNITTLWAFLFCLLGSGWFVIGLYFAGTKRTGALACVLLGCAAIVFLADDVTRVFAILTYPAIAFCLFYNDRWLSKVSFHQISIVVALWIVTPWLYDWAGKIRTTVFFYDAALCLHGLIGWPVTIVDTPFIH